MTATLDRAWRHPERIGPAVERALTRAQADTLGSAFGLLVDPTRLRMLHALASADELCVIDLGLLLDLEQSTVSRQLRLLRERGIVARRKEGRLTLYRLDDVSLRSFLRAFDGHSRSEVLAGTGGSPWSLFRPRSGAPRPGGSPDG